MRRLITSVVQAEADSDLLCRRAQFEKPSRSKSIPSVGTSRWAPHLESLDDSDLLLPSSSESAGLRTSCLCAPGGQLKTFEDTRDTGKPVHRNFCSNRGSASHQCRRMPGPALIKAGTLNVPSWVRPTIEAYCDSVQPWVTFAGGLQRFCENAIGVIELRQECRQHAHLPLGTRPRHCASSFTIIWPRKALERHEPRTADLAKPNRNGSESFNLDALISTLAQGRR
jgi:hypothetical protein